MRAICVAAFLLGAATAEAQTTAAPSSPAKEVVVGAFVYLYVLPEDSNYLQPTVTADRHRLHLEARFNYEARNTASVWAGVTFSGGDTLSWSFTPMVGGIFGDTHGVAPGYRGWITWRALEGSSEGEAVFDAGNTTGSFLYNWSELTLAPVNWLRVGLVAQRTRAYQADRVVQRGLLAGTSIRRLDVTAYLFNPDDSKPMFVLAFAVSL